MLIFLPIFFAGMIKTGGALMNKTSDTMRRFGRCETPDDIGEYDAAAERLGRICPAVDDLGACCYIGGQPNGLDHKLYETLLIELQPRDKKFM